MDRENNSMKLLVARQNQIQDFRMKNTEEHDRAPPSRSKTVLNTCSLNRLF